jgi:tetratricopeptide (TPR) repeat protein
VTLTRRQLVVFAVLLLATLFVYLPGLNGPFALDDEANLGPSIALAEGQMSLAELAADTLARPFGRPLSQLSFVYTALVVGTSPESYRLVNLLLHLLCGLLVFRLIALLALRDPSTAQTPIWLALWVTALWLASPLLLSTVLYAVQRMTQLATLFSLLALMLFVEGRQRLDRAEPGARWHLLLGVPLCLLFGFAAKENTIVVCGLLWLIELFFFNSKPRDPTTRRVLLLFFGVSVIAPLLIGFHYLLTHFVSLTDFTLRPFSLVERLLTEPRVLWDYARLLVFPDLSKMGLIHDDYPLSTTWSNPWTTGLAVVGWLGLLAAVLYQFRHSRPGIPFGLAFFLLAHSLEAGWLPLEIYFEHRNYLPAVGLYLSLGTIAVAVAQKLPAGVTIVRAVALASLPIFLFSTHLRASAWRLPVANQILDLEQHPNSPRLLSAAAAALAASGRIEQALELAQHGARVVPGQRSAMQLLQLRVYCAANISAPGSLLESMQGAKAPLLDGSLLYQLDALVDWVATGRCLLTEARLLTVLLSHWIDRGRGLEHQQRRARVLYPLARLLLAQHRMAEARVALEEAILLVPSMARLHFLLAEVELRMGHRAAARASFEAGEATLPMDSRRHQQLRFAMRHQLGLPPYHTP